MLDRVPQNPGRVLITPESGSPYYAVLTRADNPTQEGTPLNKATLLSDETAAKYGLDGDTGTVSAALDKAAEFDVSKFAVEKIIASGIWVAPKAVNQKFVILGVGGGGCGTYASSKPCGGGGGGYVQRWALTIPENTECAVVCGAGGTSSSNAGKSTFTPSGGSTYTANGGSNGQVSTSSSTYAHGGNGGGGGGGGGGGSSSVRSGNGGNGDTYGGGGGGGDNYSVNPSWHGGNGGNGGTYGGGGGSARDSDTRGTGGTYGGDGGNGGNGTTVSQDGENGTPAHCSPLDALFYMHGIPCMSGRGGSAPAQKYTGGGGGGGYGGVGGAALKKSGGGGGGYFGNGGNGANQENCGGGGGGGGYFGNGGNGENYCGGGGGGLFANGADAYSSGSYSYAGGGAGIIDATTYLGTQGGFYIIYRKEA